MNDKSIKEVGLRCCGCSVCSEICAKKAIKIEYTNEGFQYPVVGDICNNCGMCRVVCPAIEYNNKNNNISCYASVSNNIEDTARSSSGGLFMEISKVCILEGYYVVGVALTDDYYAKHIIIHSIEELPNIQGSKYVQSDLTGSIKKIMDILKSGEKVLFSGTPCQVSGLKNLLSKKNIDQTNLITVDIVCHGVPSPQFFHDHILSNYGNVNDVRFRHKTRHELSGYAIGFEKNGKYEIISPTNKDFYYACFSSQVSLRESCYTCPYTTKERVGDITLGDLCEVAKYEKMISSPRAMSLVGINTEKGKILFENLKDVISTEADYERECVLNAQMNHPTLRPKNRDLFYIDLYKNGYSESNANKYAYKYNAKEILKNTLVRGTSYRTRQIIKGITRWMKL